MFCVGADTQSFSFAFENRHHPYLYGHEAPFNRLCHVLQSAARSVWTSVSKPIQINPLSGKFISIGTDALCAFEPASDRIGV